MICLLIIILLLLHDKFQGRISNAEKKAGFDKRSRNLPDLMGPTREFKSLLTPHDANDCHIRAVRDEAHNFDQEIKGEQHPIVWEDNLDDFSDYLPDLEDEEEEWNNFGISIGNSGFAQGVTFEELSSVGMMLQEESLEPSQKETAAALIQKIQGTELFNLLENSMEDASRRIAELLDGRLSNLPDRSNDQADREDLQDFDIGEFT